MGRGRAVRATGELGRAAVLCLAPLGLVWLLARVSLSRPPAPLAAAQFAAFAAATTALARAIAGRQNPARHRANSQGQLAWAVASLAAPGALIALLPWYWKVTGLTLFAAAVEEFVFRRELPGALERLLRAGAGRWAGPVGVLLAQAAFAACHFVVMGPSGPAPAGPAFLRLAVAGVCLAGLYRASGSLVIPVALHFGVNWRAWYAA